MIRWHPQGEGAGRAADSGPVRGGASSHAGHRPQVRCSPAIGSHAESILVRRIKTNQTNT
eukprot:3784302-Pyramimonas_sp.AAC.1